MAKLDYPLKQVLEVKKKRVENAEDVVKEKIKELEREQEALKKAIEQRDKVKEHRNDKMQQLRDELDHGTTSPKIQQMKVYLKIVQDKLDIEEKKVVEQKAKVDMAEKNLEEARHQLFLRRQEVEKVEIHKRDWIKEKMKELEIAEEKSMDDMGSVSHAMRKRKEE